MVSGSLRNVTGVIASIDYSEFPYITEKNGIKYAALDFGPVAQGDVSKELIIVNRVSDPNFADISGCDVVKLNGYLPDGLTMLAGKTATYPALGPSAAGTPSTIALDAIPSNPYDLPASINLDTFNITDDQYEFLVLQLVATGTATIHESIKMLGEMGVAALHFRFDTNETSSVGMNEPAGSDNSSLYMQGKTAIYIDPHKNGVFQHFGCIDNEVVFEHVLTTDSWMKGPQQSKQPKVITERVVEFTGNVQGLSPNMWALLYKMPYKGIISGDATFEVSDQPVELEQIPMFFETFSSEGRRIRTYSAQADIFSDGNPTYGGMDAKIPFRFTLNTPWNHKISQNVGTNVIGGAFWEVTA